MNDRLSNCISKIMLWIFICGSAFAMIGRTQAKDQLTSGTSSKQARQQAIQSVPFEQLNQLTRSKISEVLEKPSIYRRLPITQIDIDPDYFVFLVRHPEVIVNIWQIMGITKMTTERIGPYELKTSDGEGTTSNVELVYGSNNIHIYYATGSYQGPILKKRLHGRCVMILRSEYELGPDGAHQAKCSLDVFLKVDNTTASLIAKTLNPIVGSSADQNFVESLNFLHRLNETTEKNGTGVQRMAGRLQNITSQTRLDFVKIAGLVYQRNAPQVNGSPHPSTYPVQPSGFQANPNPAVQPIPSSQPATLNPATAPYPKTTQPRHSGAYNHRSNNVRYPHYQAPYDRGVQPASFFYMTPRGPVPPVVYPRQRFGR